MWISTPKLFTLSEASLELLLILKLCSLVLPLLLSIVISWNWNTWTCNHAVICKSRYCTFWCVFQSFNWFFKIFRKNWNGALVSNIVQIDSAYPKKEIIIKNVKKIGANMEPCGTPESNSLKRLYVLLVLTFCLRRFK